MKVDEVTGETSVDKGVAERAKTAIIMRWKGIAATAAMLAAAVLASVLYVVDFRPAQQTDSAAQTEVLDAASGAAVALLSYSPETLDRDMERARSLMAGDFLTYYGKFTAEVVAPAVRERGIKANAQVLNSAVMEMRPNNAKVLIFLNQETVSRDRPDPALTASSVVVSLVRADNNWLISALDPV